jgi:hypothetical protein
MERGRVLGSNATSKSGSGDADLGLVTAIKGFTHMDQAPG